MTGSGNSSASSNRQEDDSQLSAYTVVQLKEKLKMRRLKTTGNKDDLIARFKAALALENEHGDPERRLKDDEDVRSEEEKISDEYDDAVSSDDDEREQAQREARRRRRREVPLTFKDVESSLEIFKGDGKVNIDHWIKDFEEMAELCEWSNIQKVAYAKRLLGGSAKLFVKYERNIKTWQKLKGALREEFSEIIDSFTVHKNLAARKKSNDETFHEYIYKMFEIADQANVEKRAVIQYIITGIQDEAVNKSLLYGAKTVRELKEKFTQYEAMKKEDGLKNKTTKVEEKKKAAKQAEATTSNKRCYNCGSKEHVSNSCPVKSKGTKCFKCNDFGHIAANCTENKSKGKVNVCSSKNNLNKKQSKQIKIGDQIFLAVIDTAADLSLMSEECHKRLGSPKLKEIAYFEGINSLNNTEGSFDTKLSVDGGTFCITFHVVKDPLMKHGVLVGADFLNSVDLRSRKGRVTITPAAEDSSEDESENGIPEVMKIDVIENDDKLDLSYIPNKDTRDTVKNIIANYKPLKTRETNIKMKLVLKDDTPVYQRPRRLSPSEKEEVNRQIEEWLAEGIIKTSISEYASPVVLVKKKNGDTRICVDFRKLNQLIIKDRYPLPLIEDQLDLLQGAKIFTTLDLKNGFFHVDVDKESQKYLSFVVPDGQYEFLKVPFGLCNSPAVFQKFINAVFKNLIAKGFVLTYMDDLVIPACSVNEAIERLTEVIEAASQAGLQINWKKCQFLKEKIDYLGHIIENGMIRPSECKTKAVIKFSEPKNVKDIQSFLGLTGYFRKCIKDYSLIARPLTNLLRNNVDFNFDYKEKQAFNELKKALASQPVLKLYKIGAETELHTDASKFGYGAILMQKDSNDNAFHPIYFASGKTTPAEEKYTSYELEVLAIIKSLKKFRVYLLGISFKIITDCKAFTMTMTKKDLSVRVARWALLLEEFSYVIQHRPGTGMKHVDALSRNPLPEAMLIDESNDSLISRFKVAQKDDQDLANIIKSAELSSINNYVIKNELLYRDVNDDYLLVVPKSMQSQIVRQAHERGHFGINKTEAIVRKEFWFKGMREKVEKIVTSCINCILVERKQGKQEGLLNVIDKGDMPLDTYHIDHLGPLQSTKKNYKHIFLVVDAFTKFVWIYPTKSTNSDEVINRLRKQATIFGNPRRIVSDRGTAFTSNAFQDYCKQEKIQHLLITTGVPRGNGQVERINRTIIPLLTKLAAPKAEEWHKYTDDAQKYLNATTSRSTGKAPFSLMFGTVMRVKEDHNVREILDEEWIAAFEYDRNDIREEAKQKIAKVQEENRKGYNKKRKIATVYQHGDLVAVKRTQLGPGLKMSPKFMGPYKIIKVMRNDRYVVQKIGEHEGPFETSASADHMKPWVLHYNDDSDE